MAEMTYEESQRILTAVKVLEGQEANGTITENGRKALAKYRGKTKTAKQAEIETIAGYRGMQAGASLNAADEIVGAYKFATDLFKNGDIEGAKQAYTKYRDLVRQRDMAAQVLAPEQYAKGQTAGSIASAAIPAAGASKLMQGKQLATQMGIGSGLGATGVALPEFMSGDGFVDSVKQIPPVGTAVGATIGAVAPIAGEIVGATTRGIQNKFRGVGNYGSKSSQLMARSANSAEAGGQDIQAYLDSIGPQGTLADVPGPTQRLAQGLASMQGEGGNILQQSITNRAQGAGGRINAEMTRRVDEPGAAFTARTELATERSDVLGPMYEAAKKSGMTFDVNPIRQRILSLAGDASADVKTALGTVLKDLGKKSDVSAAKLHNTRAALSDALSEATRAGKGNKVSSLKPVLGDIDEMLDTVPNYSPARTGYANNMAMERAIDDGRKAFTGSAATAMSPAEMRVMLDGMSDAQRDAYKKGAREYIAALMGTSRNDAAAAWGQFEKGFNAEKLAMIIGDADAASVMKTLRAESAFSTTRTKVIEGSQTGQRREAADALGDFRDVDTDRAPGPGTRFKRAIFDRPVNEIMNQIVYGTRQSKANRELGEMLSMQGPQRDQLVRELVAEARRIDDPTASQKLMQFLTTAGVLTAAPLVGRE